MVFDYRYCGLFVCCIVLVGRGLCELDLFNSVVARFIIIGYRLFIYLLSLIICVWFVFVCVPKVIVLVVMFIGWILFYAGLFVDC